ncbi:MAG: TylF/MycF/NovP-related O-methyltransferase [Bacteroidota bacterium]|nr:TylF/MycF/NovP-related O-methyltransferase [Bacteroidota bacterium]
MLKLINWALKFFRLKLIQPHKRIVPVDVEKDFTEIHRRAQPFSMVSPERLYATYQAIKYVESNNIEGDVVECGVWKGGNSMVMALTLRQCNSKQRNIYMYDTYEGMVEPGEKDIDFKGQHSGGVWKKHQSSEVNQWCYSPLEEVEQNMVSTGYPMDKVHFIKGKVQGTIPDEIPEKIAVLRLDTDWYDSTRHELIHLFPLISRNGVLLIDDYGHWKGQKEAVDEFFADHKFKPLLCRSDYSGRMMIKLE